MQEKSLGSLTFAMPSVFPGECPNGVGRVSRVAVFLNEARGNSVTHRVINGGCVFAAQPEGFEKSLAR